MWKPKSCLLLRYTEFKESLPFCCLFCSQNELQEGSCFNTTAWWTECEDLPVEGSTSSFLTCFKSGSKQKWSISVLIMEMERNEVQQWGRVSSGEEHVMSFFLSSSLSIIFALSPHWCQGFGQRGWTQWNRIHWKIFLIEIWQPYISQLC